MEKENYEFELATPDLYISDELTLAYYQPLANFCIFACPIGYHGDPESCTKAFQPDDDGDWQGVNGFELEDYEDELNEYTETVEKHILDLFSDHLQYFIDNKVATITDIDDEPLSSKAISESLGWVDRDYYDCYKSTYTQDKISGNTVPYINYLCHSPVRGSNYVLVCELCNIHFLKGEK
ncbi:MAG: hypothetical protein FVQ82_02910 [Planctomycetes bacterium]|nr:hypothetical protein [Planctomycetota bacterium]